MATPYQPRPEFLEYQHRLNQQAGVQRLHNAADRALRWFLAREQGQLSSLSDHEDLNVARELSAALMAMKDR
jgi:hypothetical protein